MMKTLANLSSMSDNVASITSALLTQSDSNNNNEVRNYTLICYSIYKMN